MRLFQAHLFNPAAHLSAMYKLFYLLSYLFTDMLCNCNRQIVGYGTVRHWMVSKWSSCQTAIFCARWKTQSALETQFCWKTLEKLWIHRWNQSCWSRLLSRLADTSNNIVIIRSKKINYQNCCKSALCKFHRQVFHLCGKVLESP